MGAEAWRCKSGMQRHPLFICDGADKLFCPLAIDEIESGHNEMAE